MISKTYCPRLWNGLQIYPNGLITVCCLWDKWFGKVQDVEDVAKHLTNNEELQKLREKALNGEPIEWCNYCYREEKLSSGKGSTRTYSIELSDLNPEKLTPLSKHDIQFLDFRVSNKCNLHCRMCWPFCSSAWENILGEKTEKIDPEKVKSLVQTIKLSKNFKELYFAGGEPFIIDEVWEILNAQIRQRVSGVVLKFNTNLTVLHYKNNDVVDTLQKWMSLGNRLELMVSYDGVGEVIEYCRTGCSWKILDNNLRAVCEGLKDYLGKGARISICPTVSLLNVLHLADLVRYAHELNVDCYIGNMLNRPRFYSLGAFPKCKKNTIIDILRQQVQEYPCVEMEQCVRFVTNEIGQKELTNEERESCKRFYEKDLEFNLINPELKDWYL